MACTICGRDACGGSCQPAPLSQGDQARDAAIAKKERLRNLGPSDTWPDDEDEDEEEDDDIGDLEDEAAPDEEPETTR